MRILSLSKYLSKKVKLGNACPNDLSIPNRYLIENFYNHYYSNKFLNSAQDRYISSYWKHYSKELEVEIDINGNIRKISGVSFGNMLSSSLFNRILTYFCHISYFVRLPFKTDALRLTKTALSVCRRIGFYFSYDCFRQVYSLVLIMRNMNEEIKNKRIVFLMIGDGYGFLSCLIKSFFPNSILVLVDIGKVLLFQSFYCQKVHPDKIHHGVFKKDININNISKYDFIYCPTECLEIISKIKYDICINIASMQEMNQETIIRYFSFMRNNMNKNNLFYCCNRELKILPGGECTEVDKYPWIAEDKYLVDEYCPWYKYFISAGRAKYGPKFFNKRIPYLNYLDGLIKHKLAVISLSN